MTQMDEQKEIINHKDEKMRQRQDRLAKQLRENLKRRKEQSRQRAQHEI
ncbi:hypothetical protein [Bartonella sp. F02]|nr:hypothetical protein [Bartonella sp. F02]MCZ2328859.1 hypothetical protein [Bartonella sp. F02]